MKQPNPMQPTKPLDLSPHEERLVRLFRCLEAAEQNRALILLAKRLLRRHALGSYRSSSDPVGRPQAELREKLWDRVQRVRPMTKTIDDVKDYDCHVEDEWRECGLDIEELLLGASSDDETAADELIGAYFQCVEDFSLPLMTDFTGPGEDEAEAERRMMQLLKGEALKFIVDWREAIVATLERRAAATKKEASQAECDSSPSFYVRNDGKRDGST